MDIKKEYFRLKQALYDETSMFSDPSKRDENQNNLDIIALGEEVVPIIIEDVKMDPSWMMRTIWEIVEEHPKIPTEHRGKLQLLTDDTINWFDENKKTCMFLGGSHNETTLELFKPGEVIILVNKNEEVPTKEKYIAGDIRGCVVYMFEGMLNRDDEL